MNNRERANRLIDFARLDSPEDWRALKDAITEALDEAEARGGDAFDGTCIECGTEVSNAKETRLK